MKTRILFLGGAGFIGSNLIKKMLKDSSYEIFVLEPIFANLSRLDNFEKNIKIIKGSISDLDLIKSILSTHNINIVVHLVSTLVPGSSYENFKKEFENVVFPTARIMELCAYKGIKFIYFSSGGTVYGNSLKGKNFCETDILAPISYYGLTKQIIENNILFESRRMNMNYLIIRPSNPYGIGQSLNGNQGFIAVAIGKILSGNPIEVWGDGSNIRDYIYIDDLSDAFYKLMKSNINNEIINIGSGFGYTINDIIHRLRNLVDIPFEVKYQNSRSVDVNSMVLDISKLKTLIKIEHTHLEDGIRTFYNNVLNNINKK